MTLSRRIATRNISQTNPVAPCLSISRIGIVSRDYREMFANGYRDFSMAMPGILAFLDQQKCDAVLFSLFSIVPRQGYFTNADFQGLANVRAVFLEEFEDGLTRTAGRYVVHHLTGVGWEEYDFRQWFGTLAGAKVGMISDFISVELPKRILGNCCVLLCGETNGVKYSPKEGKVLDIFRMRDSIPPQAHVILNPIHDRMTRFEMKLKRRFLSEKNRLVISVWNKGKMNRRSQLRDGQKPAWTLFYDGHEVTVPEIPNRFGVEIGIVDIRR